MNKSSDLRPFAVSFPDPQRKRESESFFQLVAQQFTDIFDGRVFEEVIPGTMVIMCEDISQGLLQVGKVDDHTGFRLAFDRELNLIGMPVKRPTLRVSGQEMGA